MDLSQPQRLRMRAPRLLLAMLLLCALNASFWGPQLAAVLEGLIRGEASPAFANRDLANYWLSGRLALSGDLAPLYNQHAYQDALEVAFGLEGMEIRNWSYPPHFLLITWPLGWMPYPLAYAAFLIATGAWFLFAVRSVLQSFDEAAGKTAFALVAVLLLPFILLQVLAGQNGFFFGAAMLQALIWRQRRPVAAAFMIALLTMKPQLGLLIPFLLVAERRWALMGWAAGMTAGLVALSGLIFGPEAWRGFFSETLPYQQFVASSWVGLFLYMMPTWFAALRASGIPYESALLVHGALVLPMIALCLAGIWLAKDEVSRMRLLLAGTFVLTPYAFNYDLGALLAVAAIWCLYDPDRDWPGVLLGAGVLALPLWTPLTGRPDLLLMLPPVVLSGLLLAWVVPVIAPHASRLANRAGLVR